MVFSSIPVYLDPPNWQQRNQSAAVGGENHQLQMQPPPPPPPGGGGSGSGGNMSSIRPGSMAERARQAKIPQPETALKCPRCESTNTKFCYFNNYSLTQPRHFCKTCRRYWTRGGALRNVPVGGGCRRNKRSKGNNNNNNSNNRSKSPTKAGSTSSNGLMTCTTDSITGHIIPPPSHLPILPSLHHLNNYNSTDIGLNFGGIQPPVAATAGGGMEFHQIGSTSSANGGGPGGGGSFLSNGLVDQWRLQQVQQQFPFLANIEASNGLYQFENEGINYGDQGRSNKPLESSNVKMEEMNLSKNFLGISGNNHQYWSGNNAWTDLSGFTSSSTTHLL